MACTQAKVEAVKADLTSSSGCTTSTLVLLKELLLTKPSDDCVVAEANSRATLTRSTSSACSKSKPAKTTRRAGKTQGHDTLGSRARSILATEVANAALKTLARAAKPSPTTTSRKESGELRRSASIRAFRRSNSTPLSPLRPRPLNRVATSPNLTKKGEQTVLAPLSLGCLATVECAHVAFACLRSIKGHLRSDQKDLELENGMATFIARLLALGLQEHALKEMNILKRRLDSSPISPSRPRTKDIRTPAKLAPVAPDFRDLLTFSSSPSRERLPTVTNYQSQVIRLIATSRKPAHVEALLSIFRSESKSSPIDLLLRYAQEGEKEAAKAARQLASISHLIFATVPSVSTSEDTLAADTRLSPSPLISFKLQAIALQTRIQWWKLTSHQPNVEEEIFNPLARCVRALVRRQPTSQNITYRAIDNALEPLLQAIRSHGLHPDISYKSAVGCIYHTLGSLAYVIEEFDEAFSCFSLLRASFSLDLSSLVRKCSVSARALGAALKKPHLPPEVESLGHEVMEALDLSLSGTATELNELFDSLEIARRSIVAFLAEVYDGNDTQGHFFNGQSILTSFILGYAKFLRRWVGAPLGKGTDAKALLQYDQRKHTLTRSLAQILDAVIMVVNSGIQNSTIDWRVMDDTLQHCTNLLNAVCDLSLPKSKVLEFGAYFVKISSLYFSMFRKMQQREPRSKGLSKQCLQALSRSIDAVRDRSATEKETAQLSTKLELFADFCKVAGRTDDALRTVRHICSQMAEDGVLSDVAAALKTQSPMKAWTVTEKASSLSRTLHIIAKLDPSWNDWTFFLPEAERAAVLEHLLHLSHDEFASVESRSLDDLFTTALLRIYTPERYPLRRLRVLLHIFHRGLGEGKEDGELQALIEPMLQRVQQDPGEDANLRQFVPHLHTYHRVLSALTNPDDSLMMDALRDSLSSWQSNIEPHVSGEETQAVIDDPEGTLVLLMSLINLTELKGDHQLRLSVLELSMQIARAFDPCSSFFSDTFALVQSMLATQNFALGRISAAREALNSTRTLLEQGKKLSAGALVNLHLSQAEIYLEAGSYVEADYHIETATATTGKLIPHSSRLRANYIVLLATRDMLQSKLALRKGLIQRALTCVRRSVKLLSHHWSRIEVAAAVSHLGEDASASEGNVVSPDRQSQKQSRGPRLWALASPLISSLLHISEVYAYVGMYQETVFYADSASQIATNTKSSFFQSLVSKWQGTVYARAEQPEKALSFFQLAAQHMPQHSCISRVQIALQISEFFSETGASDTAKIYTNIAEATFKDLEILENDSEPGDRLQVSTQRRAAPKARGMSQISRTTTRAMCNAAGTNRTVTREEYSRCNYPAALATANGKSDAHQSPLHVALLLNKAAEHVSRKDWTSALAILEMSKDLPKVLESSSLRENVAVATSLLGRSIEQMMSDPVFSVLQESTVSYPAVCTTPDKRSSWRFSLGNSPPKKSGKVVAKPLRPSEKATSDFVESLKAARKMLVEAFNMAQLGSSSALIYRISSLLQDTVILLSATGSAKNKTASGNLLSLAAEVGRNTAWIREQDIFKPAIEAGDLKNEGGPHCSTRLLDPSHGYDHASLVKDCVEKLPESWSVISISLSDNQRELCITKLRAGEGPFVLRLPLERANSREADVDKFDFECGRKELLEIVKRANETSHSARGLSRKDDKHAWWMGRQALDARLKKLMVNIESTWLGGFRGIFRQDRHRAEPLARFQRDFHRILDNSLPSRNRNCGRKKSKSPMISLDPRILGLFIGLGDPSNSENTVDELMYDLLYFVVDILQFHGERNAYDEIEFDDMVVATCNALRAYHDAARSTTKPRQAHTVLILDKKLHGFPWESLPCVQGLGISRVPSLACLHRLLTDAMRGTPEARKTPGHYLSARSGTYILNPSSDLDRTQKFFQQAFETLESWRSLVRRVPKETEIVTALTTSDVLLYFGHGSGAQYIRGKTIRRLLKCRATAFLMGCSSAALTEVGGFECYGPVWNYLLAGCPAVVGTLWDVTDRDIDRFAGQAFEEWGLLPRGTFSGTSGEDVESGSEGGTKINKAKTAVQSQEGERMYPEKGALSKEDAPRGARVAADRGDETDMKPTSERSRRESTSCNDTTKEDMPPPSNVSLAEAVSRARAVCRFRYLNGAAVVMYGIPVYIDQSLPQAFENPELEVQTEAQAQAKAEAEEEEEEEEKKEKKGRGGK